MHGACAWGLCFDKNIRLVAGQYVGHAVSYSISGHNFQDTKIIETTNKPVFINIETVRNVLRA